MSKKNRKGEGSRRSDDDELYLVGPDGERWRISKSFARYEHVIDEHIKAADIIVARDVKNPKKESCVFGNPILGNIIKRDGGGKFLVYHVEIDWDERYNDLELLLAYVVKHKGRHDYPFVEDDSDSAS